MYRAGPSTLLCGLLAGACLALRAEDGYELWLRYRPEPDPVRRAEYRSFGADVETPAGPARPLIESARRELVRGLAAIAGAVPGTQGRAAGAILLGTPADGAAFERVLPQAERARLGPEGFVVRTAEVAGKRAIVVAGGGDAGVLYGAFHLLNAFQLGVPAAGLDLEDAPRVPLRLANHWDNPVVGEDHWSVERGYGGPSIFHWDELPSRIDPRLGDYARLLAAMGLNGADLNNVNTAKHGLEGWRLLTTAWLPKVAAMASVLRPYGVRLYLSVNFFSPKLVGNLPTADPADPRVAAWWRAKADELYRAVPDFGGFVVKADSENEPGPYAYGRTHAQGANVIAAALAPHGGAVFWRAFVYSEAGDRVTDAYRHFRPLDGKFAENVYVQVKNGPLDFQIREPVSPLLGGLSRTNEVLELEVSQEYTGQDRHVCFLAPLWREVLDFDTHARGDGSTVERLVEGRLFPARRTGIAGVMNLGADRNWTGSLLAQANTYAFGRLAWDPGASPAEIADEWVRLTFGRDPRVVAVATRILLASRAAYEDYTAPMGLNLLTARGNHFDPAPASRVNYHRADAKGVGYDRTVATGSGYAGQYFEPWRSRYESVETCPEDLLLFFHHVPYGFRLADGETVIGAIYRRHLAGAARAHRFVDEWKTLRGRIDPQRYQSVLLQLEDQAALADRWCATVNGYFSRVSGIPVPSGASFEP